MITPFPPQISGGSKASYQFGSRLSQIYHTDITVLTYQKSSTEYLDVKNLNLTGNESLLRGIVFILFGFFYGLFLTMKINPSIIYCKQLETPSITGYLIARVSRKPLVLHTAGPDIQDINFLASNFSFFSKAYKKIFTKVRFSSLKYSVAIIANCKRDYQALQNVYPNKKSFVLYNGVDYNKFAYNAKQRAQIRRKLDISEDEFVAIFTGRASKQKQTDKLLNIAKETPKITFLIVGPTTEELRSFGEISPNLKIISRITQNIESYLNSADIFILPSKNEGLSNSLLEALSCELPAVVTPVGETPNILKHLESGILCEVEQFSSWINILKRDIKLRNKLKNNGRKLVVNNFDWNLSTRKMYKLFSSIENNL